MTITRPEYLKHPVLKSWSAQQKNNADKPMSEQKTALEYALSVWMSFTGEYTREPFEQVDEITVIGLKI